MDGHLELKGLIFHYFEAGINLADLCLEKSKYYESMEGFVLACIEAPVTQERMAL